jgi:Recombinase
MSKRERIREIISGPLAPEYLKQKADQGWSLMGVSVEWEREIEADQPLGEATGLGEEVPYGLRVAQDGLHLEENAAEKETLVRMMDLIVEDHSLSRVAEELNGRGFRTRQGALWTASAVFNMIPRLVEVGPRIFSSEEWVALRSRLSGGLR